MRTAMPLPFPCPPETVLAILGATLVLVEKA